MLKKMAAEEPYDEYPAGGKVPNYGKVRFLVRENCPAEPSIPGGTIPREYIIGNYARELFKFPLGQSIDTLARIYFFACVRPFRRSPHLSASRDEIATTGFSFASSWQRCSMASDTPWSVAVQERQKEKRRNGPSALSHCNRSTSRLTWVLLHSLPVSRVRNPCLLRESAIALK